MDPDKYKQFHEDVLNALRECGGCADGNCMFIKPVGMHTNGGCHCWEDGFKVRKLLLKIRIANKKVLDAE